MGSSRVTVNTTALDDLAAAFTRAAADIKTIIGNLDQASKKIAPATGQPDCEDLVIRKWLYWSQSLSYMSDACHLTAQAISTGSDIYTGVESDIKNAMIDFKKSAAVTLPNGQTSCPAP